MARINKLLQLILMPKYLDVQSVTSINMFFDITNLPTYMQITEKVKTNLNWHQTKMSLVLTFWCAHKLFECSVQASDRSQN